MKLVVVAVIILNGLDGQTIYVNPDTIASWRTPTSDLLHPDVKCTLQTVDGKLINVTNTCEEVTHKIGKAEE